MRIFFHSSDIGIFGLRKFILFFLNNETLMRSIKNSWYNWIFKVYGEKSITFVISGLNYLMNKFEFY